MTTPGIEGGKPLFQLDLRCPPMPRTLLEAVELMQLPGGPDIDQAVELVQHDPVAVARLLRIVNSAFYGQRGQVTSISRAVLVIGASQAVGTVMAMGLVEIRNSFDARTTAPFLNVVRHSIATGFLTQQLFSRYEAAADSASRKEKMSEAFTAGIIHDFGKLVLLYNFPEEAVPLYCGDVQTAGNLLQTERDLFGHDHVQTGLYLAERVNFPTELTRAIALHHDYDNLTDELNGERTLVYATAVANEATHAMGYGLDYSLSPESLAGGAAARLLCEAGNLGFENGRQIADYLFSQKSRMCGYVDTIV